MAHIKLRFISYVVLLLLAVITSGNVQAQSKYIFLNLELGRTTYEEALRQVKNSKYKNCYKISNGSIFIVTPTVTQNDGTVWDYVDIHFSENRINNIHFHSTSTNHNTEYINTRYKQLKNKFDASSNYTFWYDEGSAILYKYNGDCARLDMFYSNAAGKVVEIQYIDL